MDELRKAFEQHKRFKDLTDKCGMFYNAERSQYGVMATTGDFYKINSMGIVNGAWMMLQELRK